MTARLRLVPIYGAASGRHYLILDRVGSGVAQDQLDAMGARLREVAPEAIPLVFAWPVYIPQEDGEEVPAPEPEPETRNGALTVYVDIPEGQTSTDVSTKAVAALRSAGLSLGRI